MVSKKKVTISWSGGKDSAFALFRMLSSGDCDIVHLHTVISKGTRRVNLHGVHETLIERQAENLGIPLVKLYLPDSDDAEAYASLIRAFYSVCHQDGISHVVFGDIFLEDLKQYREDLLRGLGLHALFPLWGMDPGQVVKDFIASDFRTVICAADAKFFSREDVGRTIDHALIQGLPSGVDPCGERGEFHTFVYDGPVFSRPVLLVQGKVHKRSYSYHRKNADGSVEKLQAAFWFQDLVLAIDS